jgi:DNA-binding FadR family transcriptional regulator
VAELGRAVVGNLATQVATLVARRIVAGELSPGSTLPTEAELCEVYGVSRTTVREALKKLHGKGLIAGTTRAGTRVLPTSRWSQFDTDLLTWRLESGFDEALLEELYEIRVCFEPEACRIAAQHATAEDNLRIGRAFEAMAALRTEPEKLIEADLDFHMAIVDATHNRCFVTMGVAVKAALRVSFMLLQHRADLPLDELDLHGRIRDAIAAKRGKDAARTMQELIRISRRNIASQVNSPPARRSGSL